MPVADLKDEILRLAQQPVGPEPLTPPAERPMLGEPTDTDALKTEILRLASGPEPRGAMRTALAGFGEAVTGAPGKIAEGVGIATGSDALTEFGQSIAPTPDGVLPYVQPGEEGIAANVGRTIGSGATFAPLAALGGIPGALLVSGSAAAQAIPDAFYGAKANGADDDTAWKAALVSGIGQGALETVLGPERLIGKIAGAMAKADRATGGLGRELLTSAAGEGIEEASQSLWADMVAQDLYKVEPDEDWATRLSKASEQAAYGALGGGVLGSVALAAERYARGEGIPLPAIKDAPTPYADKPDRTPPVYDPIERDLTPEEESALEKWKADRGASRVDVVERPDMTEATELARKAGLDVLFVDDDGKGAKEGVTFNRSTAIVPANADPATVGLAIATHEGVHGMPKSAREALRAALNSTVPVKVGKKTKEVKSATAVALEQAEKNYADRAEKEGVKLSKADLEEEATADLVAALSPVAQRVMRNPARAVALMNDKPGVMVKVLDFARKWAGKTTHAEMVAKEIESLGEVQSALAKGMTGRQRVQAAGKIVEAFSKIDVAMKQPIRPRLKASAEPIGPAAAPEPTAVEARGEDVPVDPGLGALRAKDEPAPAPVVSAKTKTLQESLDERAVSARGRATEKEARAQAIESRPRVTKAARRRAARLRNQAKMLNEGAASMETQSKALAWKNRDPNEQKSPGDRVRFEDGREGTVASSHEDGSLRVRVQRPPGKGESAEDAARVMYDYVTVRAPDVLRVEAARPVEQSQAKAAPVAKDAPVPVRTEKPIALTASKEAIANEFDKLSKKQTHYMGHKGDFFKKAANWLAGNLDLRGVKTIYDMYAGGGTYGLTYALSGVAPDVQRVVVNEVDAIRRHKFDIARRHGGDIMDPWDTSPFLIELRNTIDALVAGNDSTSPASLAIDTITGAESAKGAYEQYLPMRSRYQALSIDEKAALLALRDVMFSGRTATVAKLFENARQDADNVRLLVKRAAARGIKVEVVSMDALGPEAIKMVHGGGRSFVVLDPPYHGTASGNYSAGGKKYDFKSDEFLQMNLAAAKEMSRGNTVLYNNAATDGVRAGALAAFGSQMQTFEWLRQKRGDAPAQQEFLGVIDNGQGKSSGSRGNVGVGSASSASGKAGGNGGVLATARGDGRGQAGTGATGDARGAGGGDARYSLASDAGAQGDDVEAARKAWKEQGTDSPWFKRWFGDSVVKKGGKPLVMYHGTDQDFAAFDKRLGGSATLARDAQGVMFFTSSPHVAEDFAGYVYRKTEDGKDVERRYGNGANIMPVYLKAENPLVWEMGGGSYTDSFLADAIKEAKSEGYDSVIFADMRDGSVSTVGPWKKSNIVAVFEPTQIKSATGNRGTFSPANPDIRYSLGQEGKKYRYRMQYRPPGFDTLPSGVPFTTEPASKENPFGVAVYDKPLPFKDEEAYQLEPLDPNHPKNIRKTVEARRGRIYEALSESDTVEGQMNGRVYVLGPDTRRPDKMRLTSFDPDGTPTGHMELGEISDAMDEAARMGFEPKRSDVRFSLASDAGAQGEDVEAARKAWKEQGTDSPWFRRWFAGSKVVDGEGKPLVVYHGSTEKGVTRFDPRKAVEVEGGIFFSSNEDVASQYTFERAYGDIISDEPLGDVTSAYLSIQNPLEWKTKPGQRIVDAIEMGRAIKAAKAGGHDGVIVRNIDDSIGMTGDMGDTYIVFKPTQIKSTGNRGTFSPANPDIRYSLKSDIESVAADLSEPEGYQPAVASEEMPSRMVAKYVRAMNPVERKGVEEMMAEADAILADRGAREKLARRAMNHEALNEGEQIALQRIASLKATNAWRQGASMDNAVEAQFAFQQARTTAGRVLGNPALRDALQSPAERAMGLALSPSKQVARAYKKAKTWQARRAIVEEEARKIERIRYSLAQKGFDPALIPDDYFKDPTFRNVWAESVADAKANGKWDWYIQWRRAAMLSGPITTIRNVTGNTSYVTYDRIARIWADAVIPGTGTSVEDARVYTRDLFAGIAQGWKDARAAYSAFYDASTEGTSLDEHATFRRGPIMVGLEAVGIRAQAAQDIFFRSVVGAAETRLRARQKARAEGGTAEDYMSDPDVLAMSKEDMERALFLDRDALTRSITGARDWLDEKARFPVGTTIVPFAATPTKIVQRGGETLLGPLGGYMRDREKWGGALLGAGAWAAMIWAASMFDDDDGLPLITGSRARGGQGDFQDRTAPAYSIRIGDEYYSYQTIEPLSTALAAIADAVQSEDPMKSVSSFAAAAKDKSFFRSIETVYDAIVGAANGERGSDRAKQVARDLLWTPMIPNIVRSPVRAADETRRKELGNPLEAEDFLNAAVPTGDFGPPLRYDLWGRPAEKAGGSWVSRVLAPAMGTKDVEDVEKIDLLLADYNRKSDEDKFFSAPQVYVERNNIRRDWTEEEYSELTRDAGAQALTILRPWAANKTELTERDLKHISDVLSKTRARKVEELLRR